MPVSRVLGHLSIHDLYNAVYIYNEYCAEKQQSETKKSYYHFWEYHAVPKSALQIGFMTQSL